MKIKISKRILALSTCVLIGYYSMPNMNNVPKHYMIIDNKIDLSRKDKVNFKVNK